MNEENKTPRYGLSKSEVIELKAKLRGKRRRRRKKPVNLRKQALLNQFFKRMPLKKRILRRVRKKRAKNPTDDVTREESWISHNAVTMLVNKAQGNVSKAVLDGWLTTMKIPIQLVKDKHRNTAIKGSSLEATVVNSNKGSDIETKGSTSKAALDGRRNNTKKPNQLPQDQQRDIAMEGSSLDKRIVTSHKGSDIETKGGAPTPTDAPTDRVLDIQAEEVTVTTSDATTCEEKLVNLKQRELCYFGYVNSIIRNIFKVNVTFGKFYLIVVFTV